jgi:hypothetical protein
LREVVASVAIASVVIASSESVTAVLLLRLPQLRQITRRTLKLKLSSPAMKRRVTCIARLVRGGSAARRRRRAERRMQPQLKRMADAEYFSNQITVILAVGQLRMAEFHPHDLAHLLGARGRLGCSRGRERQSALGLHEIAVPMGQRVVAARKRSQTVELFGRYKEQRQLAVLVHEDNVTRET